MARGADDDEDPPNPGPVRKTAGSPYPGPPPYPVLPPLSRPTGRHDQPKAPRCCWLGWVLTVVIIVGGFVLAFLLSWLFDLQCGHIPVGESSPQATVCRSAGESTPFLPLAGWLVASAVLIWVCARWTLLRTDAFWLAWAMVLPLLVPLAAYAALNAPSDECSPDQRSDPAYECDHF